MAKRLDYLREARGLTVEQLTAKIQISKKSLIEEQQNKLLGKVKNTAARRRMKREIAQLMTLRDEKAAEKVKENPNA